MDGPIEYDDDVILERELKEKIDYLEHKNSKLLEELSYNRGFIAGIVAGINIHHLNMDNGIELKCGENGGLSIEQR
jgi:hydroxymethylglutaryl-CoA reductase